MEDLGAGYKVTSRLLSYLAPRFIRDRLYEVVGANRYNILGKRDECRCGEEDSEPERFIG